jgi:hypothetical protein
MFLLAELRGQTVHADEVGVRLCPGVRAAVRAGVLGPVARLALFIGPDVGEGNVEAGVGGGQADLVHHPAPLGVVLAVAAGVTEEVLLMVVHLMDDPLWQLRLGEGAGRRHQRLSHRAQRQSPAL